MQTRTLLVVTMLSITTLLGGLSISIGAQDKPHVVSLNELNKDSAKRAEKRNLDESAVRELLSTEQAQKVLQSSHIAYKKIDKAIGRLDDQELANLAQRSRQVQADFAAGRISKTLIVVIVAAVAVLIILVVSLPND